MEILLGCDPELWVKKEDKIQSAYGLIKGNKQHPFVVPSGAVQVDGMALEFNTNPTSDEDEFISNITTVMSELKKLVPDYTLAIEPVVEFGEEYMLTQPKEATTLGCSVDYNGWTNYPNKKPDSKATFRTASGHVHIGWTKDEDLMDNKHRDNIDGIIQNLDFFLGLPSVILEGQNKRRDMYGKAGAYRPKSYGCEYRTLSNFWIRSPKLMRLIFNNTQMGVRAFFSGRKLKEEYGDIQSIINTGNKKMAIDLLNHAGIPYAV